MLIYRVFILFKVYAKMNLFIIKHKDERYRLFNIFDKALSFISRPDTFANTSSNMLRNLLKSGILSHDSIFNSSVNRVCQAAFCTYLKII